MAPWRVKMSAARAGVIPRLDAFDEEFGRDESDSIPPPPPNTGFKLSTVIGLALAAGVISAVALGWPNGPLGDSKTSQGVAEAPEAAVQRLTREVDMLKRDLQELADEHQRATSTIASLQAQQENRRLSTWYSEPAGLIYGFTGQQSEANAAAPPPRRAVVRAKPREVQPREESAPLPLDPQ
jgi:hypothetical protein